MSTPNILIIVADDLGWADVGYHDSAIRTPNIDALVESGVELDNHYVTPLCTPTRVALLTGKYPSRWGNHARTPCNNRVLPFGALTLASMLKSAGYNTGLFGKWHLGSQPEWGPNHFGFDYSYGSLAGGVTPYGHHYKTGPHTNTWHRNEKLVDEEGHVTDLIGKEAVEWLDSRAAAPWFCYVPFTAVHIPISVPSPYKDMYEEGAFFPDDPAKDESARRYAAYATQMDEWIGRILAAIRRRGEERETFVLFFSDNGASGSWRAPGLYPDEQLESSLWCGSNMPLRGRKGHVYEGGIRTPAVAAWPGTLKPTKLAVPLHAVDWLPTLAHLAGANLPQDADLDGIDVWPLLGGTGTTERDAPLYFPFVRGQWAVRDRNWKLLCPGRDRPPELYHITRDPFEKHNVADDHPDQVARLTEHLQQVSQEDRKARVPDR